MLDPHYEDGQRPGQSCDAGTFDGTTQVTGTVHTNWECIGAGRGVCARLVLVSISAGGSVDAVLETTDSTGTDGIQNAVGITQIGAFAALNGAGQAARVTGVGDRYARVTVVVSPGATAVLAGGLNVGH